MPKHHLTTPSTTGGQHALVVEGTAGGQHAFEPVIRNPEPAHWFADFDPFGNPATWPAQVQVNNANRFRIDPAYWPEATHFIDLPVKVYRREVATGIVTFWENLTVSGTSGIGGIQDYYLNASPGNAGAGYLYERMEVYMADNVTLLYRDYGP